MKGRYTYDRRSNTFRKVTRSVGNIALSVLKYTIAVLALTVAFYVIFALLVSTDEEKALQKENRLYRRLYAELEQREALLSGVVEGLQATDNEIYGSLFAADAPPVEPVNAADFIARSGALSEQFFLSYSASKMKNAARMSVQVEENFREVMRILEERERKELPPMRLPLEGMDYAQTGASVGTKINPFFQVEAVHTGLDLIARQGESVYAVADGTVSDVIRNKGRSVVVLDHGNGYQTRYAFVTGVTVSRGQTVRQGRKIGAVGLSRGSYAPHLHFEVLHGGEIADPVHYFFASVTPQDYAQMLYFSAITNQSMD